MDYQGFFLEYLRRYWQEGQNKESPMGRAISKYMADQEAAKEVNFQRMLRMEDLQSIFDDPVIDDTPVKPFDSKEEADAFADEVSKFLKESAK